MKKTKWDWREIAEGEVARKTVECRQVAVGSHCVENAHAGGVNRRDQGLVLWFGCLCGVVGV